MNDKNGQNDCANVFIADVYAHFCIQKTCVSENGVGQ